MFLLSYGCFSYFMYMSFLMHVCACVCVHVPAVHRGQKRCSNPLELEVQMVVSYTVSAENELRSFSRTSVLDAEPALAALFFWIFSSGKIVGFLVLTICDLKWTVLLRSEFSKADVALKVSLSMKYGSFMSNCVLLFPPATLLSRVCVTWSCVKLPSLRSWPLPTWKTCTRNLMSSMGRRCPPCLGPIPSSNLVRLDPVFLC